MSEQAESLLSEILEELRVQNRHSRLWDTDDIGWYFGLSANSVRARLVCRADFPKPVQVQGLGRRWRPGDVKAYAQRAK